ncbi:inorganic polyphosphate/ATP-NAD kinase [Entomoplasma ellychniae]|uniref:Inorganic polyphosphate/ATP-NAD kinase n=2 Tax=Entomoplasmataceae TaxID=33925 RepID=A0A2S5RGQ9_9MOLU|nr:MULTISPECIES: NAD(+)/NADH kinase [Entomoplasmataceae]PPE04987.1 inorganic polyphosphate/ATP-NAD kinase [Entomoplasma ellychniae]PPE06481.1 inorganic polyphosphate/ATP-NAD kinase [Mesoplasma corruscae]
MRYTIVKNEYKDSLKKAEKIIKVLKDYNWIEDKLNPEVIFVIGGDGTFLTAAEQYNHILDNVLFIPVKSGGIGFYTNHNRIEDIKKRIDGLKRTKPLLIPLLEANHYKAINEIKILNSKRPLRASVLINDELLEEFKGTGLAFTTPSGSTGFSKSQGGAVIIDETNIFQMLEMAPVSNNIFRTIHAPIILSKNHHIKVILDGIKDVEIIVDGVSNKVPENGIVNVCLSSKHVKLVSAQNEHTTKIQILKDMFTLNKKFED